MPSDNKCRISEKGEICEAKGGEEDFLENLILELSFEGFIR